MLKSLLVNKDFQTWHLIGWQRSRQPIRSHVRKSLSTDMNFNMDFLSNPAARNRVDGFGWKKHSGTFLTRWGRVTHICVSDLTIIGSDNGLSPGRRQAIIWTNAGILLIGPLRTNFIEILIGIQTFSFKKMHLKLSSGKCRPSCLGLNVLTQCSAIKMCSIFSIIHTTKISTHFISLYRTLLIEPGTICIYEVYFIWDFKPSICGNYVSEEWFS